MNIKETLNTLRKWAEAEQAKIPEVFNDISESENWNFYEGFLSAITQIEAHIDNTTATE